MKYAGFCGILASLSVFFTGCSFEYTKTGPPPEVNGVFVDAQVGNRIGAGDFDNPKLIRVDLSSYKETAEVAYVLEVVGNSLVAPASSPTFPPTIAETIKTQQGSAQIELQEDGTYAYFINIEPSQWADFSIGGVTIDVTTTFMSGSASGNVVFFTLL